MDYLFNDFLKLISELNNLIKILKVHFNNTFKEKPSFNKK